MCTFFSGLHHTHTLQCFMQLSKLEMFGTKAMGFVKFTSKLKEGWHKKKGDKIGMELGTHNEGEACGANITKGCKANSYT